MTYENDVDHTDYIIIVNYEVFKCFIKTVNIHIEKLDYKFWTIFTLGRAFISRPFDTLKF